MKNATVTLPGCEIRGYRFKVYPDSDTLLQLESLQNDARLVWNWLISRRGDRLKDILAHFGDKYDYQLCQRILSWYPAERTITPGAHFFQALVKAYFTKASHPKRRRRRIDPMPVRVRSGKCFEVGDFGTRRGNPFYNCQVRINGLTIRGRLSGYPPPGDVLEGVSLVKEADGWWASIKCNNVPKRVPPPAVPGSVIGVDAGLNPFLAAFSDGTRIENTRTREYTERIAGRQAMKKPVGRLHLRARRNAKHHLINAVVKPLANVAVIAVEALPADIGQRGTKNVSYMRTMIAYLKRYYGDRVREVEPQFTSQDCSQCGQRSKDSWSYDHGRYGECPFCGYREDRDVNAARNIARKAA